MLTRRSLLRLGPAALLAAIIPRRWYAADAAESTPLTPTNWTMTDAGSWTINQWVGEPESWARIEPAPIHGKLIGGSITMADGTVHRFTSNTSVTIDYPAPYRMN